jgi:LAO/AO transport system kinase
MSARISSHDLLTEALNGHPRGIARLMSRVEADDPECREAMAEIYRHTGRAHLIGITGVPGAGKSTLVRSLARELRKTNRKVGIVAIDPSSPFTGGAILGDRIRMNELAGDPGVFVRSMATRGALGGLARAALDVVDLLDAAGFDVVLLETVGVGQDEVDVVQAVHTTVVISAPGLGDDIQAIKAGILEIADIHAVSKCDRADANRTIQDLQTTITMGLGQMVGGAMVGPGREMGFAESEWRVPVIPTSAEKESGIAELLEAIDRHRKELEKTGEIIMRKRRIAEMRLLKTAETILRSRFQHSNSTQVEELIGQVATRQMTPYRAARDLITTLDKRDGD